MYTLPFCGWWMDQATLNGCSDSIDLCDQAEHFGPETSLKNPHQNIQMCRELLLHFKNENEQRFKFINELVDSFSLICLYSVLFHVNKSMTFCFEEVKLTDNQTKFQPIQQLVDFFSYAVEDFMIERKSLLILLWLKHPGVVIFLGDIKYPVFQNYRPSMQLQKVTAWVNDK